MVEKYQNPTNKNDCKSLSSTIIVLVMVCITILMVVPVVTALEFDNVKSYDSKTKTATIDNAFGLGGTLAEIQLISNGCAFTSCEATIKLDLKQDYDNPFKEFNLYDMNKGLMTTNRKHDILIDGKPYDYGLITEGVHTVKITGKIKPGDRIEWIPKFLGKNIDEWAIWQSGFDTGLFAYYNFSGEAEPVNNYNMNLSGGSSFTATGGFIGKAGKVNSTNTINVSGEHTAFAFQHVGQELTIAGWIKSDSEDFGLDTRMIAKQGGGGANGWGTFWRRNSNVSVSQMSGSQIGSETLLADTWYHLAVIKNSSHACLYINANQEDCQTVAVIANVVSNLTFGGSFQAGDTAFEGMFDEFGFWTKNLSTSEISDLYNGGDGLSRDAQEEVLLVTPSGFQLINNVSFNGTSGTTSGTNDNITLIIDGVSNVTQAATGTFDALEINYTMQYGVHTFTYSSYIDDVLINSTETRTFAVGLLNTSELFSSSTTEGSTELFQLNLTNNMDIQLSTATLVYNNTNYGGTISIPSTNKSSVYKALEIPSVTTKLNNTFYWSLVFEDSTRMNTSSRTQEVSTIGIDNCSTNTNLLYNFTMVDEITQEVINNSIYNTTSELNLQLYTLDRSDLVRNFTLDNNVSSNFSVCLSTSLAGSEEYSLDLQVRYDADEYASEFYHIQNSTIDSTDFNTNITLYDLEDSRDQEFLITFKDSSFALVADALIQVQRRYVSEGVFKTVEIPKTDSLGQTVAHLELADVIYTFVVVKNGVVLGTFTNVMAVCQDIVLGNCEIKLNQVSSSTGSRDFTVLDDLTLTLTYTQSTRTIESIFTVPSGTPKEIKLNATLFDGLGETEVCSDSLTSSSGTLTCVAPIAFGNSSMFVVVTSEGDIVAQQWVRMTQTNRDIFGSSIIFLTIFLYLTLIGVGISDNPIITGMFILIGAVLGIGLNLVNSPSYFGAGATILWLFIIIIIVLIKGARRS